ncbi:MAG: hypothetical protein AAFO51_03980 [Pseudomonadota bacterium]
MVHLKSAALAASLLLPCAAIAQESATVDVGAEVVQGVAPIAVSGTPGDFGRVTIPFEPDVTCAYTIGGPSATVSVNDVFDATLDVTENCVFETGATGPAFEIDCGTATRTVQATYSSETSPEAAAAGIALVGGFRQPGSRSQIDAVVTTEAVSCGPGPFIPDSVAVLTLDSASEPFSGVAGTLTLGVIFP